NTIDRPVPPSAWRKVGPAAVPVLTELATSPSELPIRRARAVEALSIVGGDAATETTRRIAGAADEAWDVRAAAVRGLGRLLPPDRLVAELRPVLERDPHPNVRDVAATVLARKGGATGCAAVRAQARRDVRPGRAPYARALARCR
ncbi:MAG TPA: HEAT repeat domain-containing protein, partial [Anaeromyxobacteraceae bacterium]|nr:HEAT repeat domain-containing protein [Anaeromyxobacteraceae bacterium]